MTRVADIGIPFRFVAVPAVTGALNPRLAVDFFVNSVAGFSPGLTDYSQ